MKAVCRFILHIALPWYVVALPLLAHAETDACTLLTPVQVAAAVGGAMSDGTHVTPTFVKTCTWTPSGNSKLGSVTLSLQTAAFYDVFPAHDRPMKPAGEWNTSEVIVRGKHVEHWLNGKKVLEYEMESPELLAAIQKSKFKGIDRFSKLIPGHILVQDHGDAVWFRKIEILPSK